VPLDPQIQGQLADQYRGLLREHGDAPEACQWSPEGQRFRFEKLAQIAPLAGRIILDVGCGLGHLYPFLNQKFGAVQYTGIDIVPEMIAHAAKRHPEARFLVHDLLHAPLPEKFDYVLMSGPFNNAMPEATEFLKELVSAAFAQCSAGLGFNFTSTHVNFRDAAMAYHDPAEVLDFCLRNLTRRVVLDHHYERCDVAVFAYR